MRATLNAKTGAMQQTNILLESGTNELEVVEFFIDEHGAGESGSVSRTYYGMNVAKVLEIIRLPVLTDLPDASHPSVMGAFDLRSEIIPLINLAPWVGKKPGHLEGAKVIVTEFNEVITAFLVSGVTRIYRIGWVEVKAPSLQIASLASNSVTGIVKLDGKIVFILDLEKIVAALNPESIIHSNITQETVKQIEKRELKAVIADDSAMVRNMLFNLLTENGFIVNQFMNGQAAWTHLSELKDSAAKSGRPITDYVSIVISDIEMPAMDGHHLTKRIKDDPALREIPVLLCSSIITESLYHKGVEVGADDQISKANLDKLVSKVIGLISPGQAV
jgi:two-component system, chemotaxis family, chemotaxis protein CheV